jgi:dienelactone hydrolase/pimeloyl-ACP methyl ester carboxylesterase
MADENPFDLFLRDQGRQLRQGDGDPTSLQAWEKRRIELRKQIRKAMGPLPDVKAELAPQMMGTLERDGYRIEKLVFQSRPNLWVTATAYVPAAAAKQKVPAVLAVHGHWKGARRDPVVQARCLGLVKLGFFVLAVDALGAGERHAQPAPGTYHGGLDGATLWPVGHSLLGMQVYDNHRAINYLLTRPEVNGKFGVTGASGGGNQSMYAGALDDRIQAVVPVCSVGNYQAYLRAACCVCEVLPGALRFTEEGDILGLTAPRALMVISASKDALQFSPAEAEKSLQRAQSIYKLHDRSPNLRHVVFESGHDYSQPMREAMYGWMMLHLKGEGKGEPIPEPAHTVEKMEDLACFPNLADRPKGFLTLAKYAASAGRAQVDKINTLAPSHSEMWDATSDNLRADLADIFPGYQPRAVTVKREGEGEAAKVQFRSEAEKIPLGPSIADPGPNRELDTAVIVLHLDGHAAAEKHPIIKHFRAKNHWLYAPNLRGCGPTKPPNDAIAGVPDHNSAEHGVWIGRPLLEQWVSDTVGLLHAIRQEWEQFRRVVVVGIGPASLVALAASALRPRDIQQTLLIDTWNTLITETPYPAGTPMGLLAPGLLKAGDIPQIAGLLAPRSLYILGSTTPTGNRLSQESLNASFGFTKGVYRAMKQDELNLIAEPNWDTLKLEE